MTLLRWWTIWTKVVSAMSRAPSPAVPPVWTMYTWCFYLFSPLCLITLGWTTLDLISLVRSLVWIYMYYFVEVSKLFIIWEREREVCFRLGFKASSLRWYSLWTNSVQKLYCILTILFSWRCSVGLLPHSELPLLPGNQQQCHHQQVRCPHCLQQYLNR